MKLKATMIAAALAFAIPMMGQTETSEAEEAPAFPGAEGFGRYVTGGRGGTVYHVTNLNDSGTGSLRYGLESQSGKRTIVFDVAGYIDLKSQLNIKNGNVTVAGQTAPEPGITVRYYTVQNKASNVIIRFIRFRRSQVKDVNDGADASWGRQCQNIIFDHCSFSWSIDEICSYYDNKNFTMQWCTIAEALANPGHSKGEHSYGGIWGGKGASFHHNYLAHMQNRVPRFNGARYNWTGYDKTLYANSLQAERVDFRNCVMYNWGTGGCYGGPGGGYINMVNNYYKAGPGTVNRTRVTQVTVGATGNMSSGELTFLGYASRYYIKGNYVTAAGASAEDYDWNGVVYDSGLSTIDGERYIPDTAHYYGADSTYVKNSSGLDCISLKLGEQVDAGVVTTQTAEVAYENVLNYMGACIYRDAVDARFAEETRTGTATYKGTVTKRAGIIDVIGDPSQSWQDTTLVQFPVLESTSRAEGYDTDQDGMPDEWETANGLDPNDASDGNTYTLDTEKGWYTNLEVYLNSIVEGIMKAGNADAVSAVDEYYPTLKNLTTATPTNYYVADERPTEEPAASESAVETIGAGSQVVGFEYYTLEGKRITEPQQGLSIRRTIYRNGKAVSEVVIKK